jgi:hypothetical protein
MTQEQDARNWQTLQQYKQLRAERDQRENMARHWGNIFVSKGELLVSGGITVADLNDIPEKTAMLETQRELRLLHDQIASLRKELEQKGMRELL